MKQHPTPGDYLAMFKRMYHNGQKRLVIPRWLAETPGFTEAFNKWTSRLAICGANYLDVDTDEQVVCMDLPDHAKPHFGIGQIVREKATEVGLP